SLLDLDGVTENVPRIFARKNVHPGERICIARLPLLAWQRSTDWGFASQHPRTRSGFFELRDLSRWLRARNAAKYAHHLRRHAVEHGRPRGVRTFHLRLRNGPAFQRAADHVRDR